MKKMIMSGWEEEKKKRRKKKKKKKKRADNFKISQNRTKWKK